MNRLLLSKRKNLFPCSLCCSVEELGFRRCSCIQPLCIFRVPTLFGAVVWFCSFEALFIFVLHIVDVMQWLSMFLYKNCFAPPYRFLFPICFSGGGNHCCSVRGRMTPSTGSVGISVRFVAWPVKFRLAGVSPPSPPAAPGTAATLPSASSYCRLVSLLTS
jgi:hypothetical protein